MVDEKKETKKGSAPDNSGERVLSETISELDRADQIAERQKRENDRREELLKREESLEARRAVGGRAEGGSEPEKPKEETPKEYADAVLSGKYNVKKE